jgi:hypothetical protein
MCSPGFITHLLENKPRSYSEVISYHEAFYWNEAINNKIESFM